MRAIVNATLIMFPIYLCIFCLSCESVSLNDKDIRDTVPDFIPLPLPTTTTTTIPPTSDLTEASQQFTHPAPITDRIGLVQCTERGIWFAGAPRPWPIGEGTCNGEAHLYIKRNGKWVGGKFEHVRATMGDRGWGNIRNGYQIWSTLQPIKGESIAYMMISYDGKKRTNAIFSTWKG